MMAFSSSSSHLFLPAHPDSRSFDFSCAYPDTRSFALHSSALCDDDFPPYLHALTVDPDPSACIYPHHRHNRSLSDGEAKGKPLALDLARPTHIRSLTIHTIPESPDEDMSATDTAPGSPPELTPSRSSTKSSSRRSSSNTREEVEDPSHFEEISLDDVQQHPVRTSSRNPIRPRTLVNTSKGGSSRSPSPRTSSSPTSREPANELRTAVTLNNHARNAKSRPKPPGVLQRRALTSNAILPVPINTRRRASPPSHGPHSASPVSAGTASPRLRSENTPTPVLPPRRSSWQPTTQRKSTKELEQEYHDSDEDLPDDAIVWNIPLSPRPPNSRQDSMVLMRATRINSAPEPPPAPSRTKSWSEALTDLSDEAKKLTAALEEHADLSPHSSFIYLSSPTSKSRAKLMELPPVQRSNAMIDPLPVSKEKEKHLTRTRPSWLPPKNPKEEARHLKQYQQMMSSYYDAEKRRSATQLASHAEAGATLDTNARFWTAEVLPNFAAAVKSPRVRELWWSGIPPSVRGRVWAAAIGNDLHITPTTYAAALSRADDLPSATLSALDADIAAAAALSPHYTHPGLRPLLTAYAAYRRDTGHVRGSAPIAALLLLHIPHEPAAFAALANLLNGAVSLPFCVADAAAKSRLRAAAMRRLARKLPRLHAHLDGLPGLQHGEVLDALLQGLCAATLAAEEAARVWDVFVFEGEAGLLRAVVGLLRRLEGRLYGGVEEVMALLGWEGKRPVDVGGPEKLVEAMRWAGREETGAQGGKSASGATSSVSAR